MNQIIYCIYKYNKDNTRSPITYYSKEPAAIKLCKELNADLAKRNIDNANYDVVPIVLIED
jgi:hypothetical protein